VKSADIEDLVALVPPPIRPAQVGTQEEWDAVQAAIGLSLPDELAELSMRYGSGFFKDGDFTLTIFNVFGPLFVDRCKFRRAIRTDLGFQNSGDPWAAFLRDKFEFARVDWSQEGGETYVLWDMAYESAAWPICVPAAGNWQQRFNLRLVPFLVEAFSGRLVVERFPSRFENLRFVSEPEMVPAE
jgi:hypothetical protein